MRQAVLAGARNFTMITGPMADVAENEVVIKVHYCGVCMGEVATWSRSLDGGYPLSMGHEISGRIVDKGSAVSGFEIGQAVMAITMGRGYATHVSAETSQLVAVPENVSLKAASLGEPLACAVNAASRAGVLLGDTVVIVGSGFMGLLMLQLVRLLGASRVFMVDLRQELAPVALDLGAKALISPEQAKDVLNHATDGRLADVVIEATGSEAALQLAGELVRIRGTLVIYGYHQDGFRAINIGNWNWKGIDVVNGHERSTERYVQGLRQGMALAGQERVQLESLITQVFSGDDMNQAFAIAQSKPTGFIKAVTDWTAVSP